MKVMVVVIMIFKRIKNIYPGRNRTLIIYFFLNVFFIYLTFFANVLKSFSTF